MILGSDYSLSCLQEYKGPWSQSHPYWRSTQHSQRDLVFGSPFCGNQGTGSGGDEEGEAKYILVWREQHPEFNPDQSEGNGGLYTALFLGLLLA